MSGLVRKPWTGIRVKQPLEGKYLDGSFKLGNSKGSACHCTSEGVSILSMFTSMQMASKSTAGLQISKCLLETFSQKSLSHPPPKKKPQLVKKWNSTFFQLPSPIYHLHECRLFSWSADSYLTMFLKHTALSPAFHSSKYTYPWPLLFISTASTWAKALLASN